MHNPAPVLENNTRKLLWDFDIHTDHLISDRRPDLMIINKKKKEKKKEKKKRTCKIVNQRNTNLNLKPNNNISIAKDDRLKMKENWINDLTLPES